jgi:hypothetical protein
MVCEKMCWTYQEFENQPDWFIQLLLFKWSLDNEHQNKNARQNSPNSH